MFTKSIFSFVLLLALASGLAAPVFAQQPAGAEASAPGQPAFYGGPQGSHHLSGWDGFAHYVDGGFVLQRDLEYWKSDFWYVYYREKYARNRAWAFYRYPDCWGYVPVYKRFPWDRWHWQLFHYARRTPTYYGAVDAPANPVPAGQ